MSLAIGVSNKILSSPRYKWWVFGTVGIGVFVSLVDQTGVNLALPRIADHFDATIPAVQWLTLGYTLSTGSLLLPMGRLADIIGRKRVYMSGFVIFTIAALLTGSSTSLIAMIMFKILQGVGAAMIQSTSMAILTSTFPSKERGKAIGLFMTIVGLGAIAGPVLGGAVVGQWGWRFLFFLVAPFGLASVLVSLVVLDGQSVARKAGSVAGRFNFDWAGAVLSAGALAVFLLVMTNAYRVGWGSPVVIVALVAVLVLIIVFIRWETRVSEPMLAMDLFKNRLFSLGSSAAFLGFLAGPPVFMLMPFYLQGVLDFSPGRAGLVMAPTALAYATTGPIAGRLSDKYGWRKFTVAGLILIAGSLVSLSRLTADSSVMLVIPSLLVQGIGMGAFYSPNASAVLSTVDKESYGIATAYLNMVRNVATVTGIALSITIVTAVMSSRGYEPSLDAVSAAGGAEGLKAAFTQGLRISYLAMSGSIVVAIALATLAGRAPADASSPEPDRRQTSKV
jgi:EmrB/QacA subfamily drug resistance transporter